MKLLFIFILTCNVVYSQNKIDKIELKNVEKEITNSHSDFFYPKLLKRLQAFDSTLTIEDYRMLYYGFAFNKNYTAFEDDKSKEIQDLIKSEDYPAAIKTCDLVLEKIPICIKANYLKGYCLFCRNKNDSLSFSYRSIYHNLMKAIISSGDGLTCKTGFKVLFIGDEYEIMYKYFEISEFKGQALQGNCDVLNVEPSDKYKEPSIFFDATEILKKESEMFDKK